MLICILIFFISLFYLSYEITELPRFGRTSFYTFNSVYLDTSKNNKGDTIKISVEILTPGNIRNFKAGACFNNEINFSKISDAHYNRAMSDYDYSLQKNIYNYYYDFKMNDNYKYLLLSFECSLAYGSSGYIKHLDTPTSTSVELINYGSLLVNSSSYVYLTNSFYGENNIYFSFTFESNENLNKYNIYYKMEDYKDDRAFSNLYSKVLENPRKKNNKYTFYFNMELYNSKSYICLKPGDVDGLNNLINITQLPRLPIELKEGKRLYVNSNNYIFINTGNYTAGTELYFQIITFKNTEDLILKYKFNEDNFYEDFVNMENTKQSNIYDEKINDGQINTTYYYTIIVENITNFLLLEIPKIDVKNFIILQTDKDEYQIIINKKRTSLILYITISSILILVLIIIIIIVNKIKKRKNKVEIMEKNEGDINEEINYGSKIEKNNKIQYSATPYDLAAPQPVNYTYT